MHGGVPAGQGQGRGAGEAVADAEVVEVGRPLLLSCLQDDLEDRLHRLTHPP
jgi:hypothetical protein